ncbi:MAG: hypothetical protein ACRD29_06375 [Acidimicrobiales bacterium]
MARTGLAIVGVTTAGGGLVLAGLLLGAAQRHARRRGAINEHTP